MSSKSARQSAIEAITTYKPEDGPPEFRGHQTHRYFRV